MEDHRVLSQLVEVRDGGEEDGGGCGDGDKLARANWREDGEERVGIVSNREDLWSLVSFGAALPTPPVALDLEANCNAIRLSSKQQEDVDPTTERTFRHGGPYIRN